MYEIEERTKNGGSKGTVLNPAHAIAYVSKLHNEAKIKSNGVLVGRVWKDDEGRWNWFVENPPTDQEEQK